MWEFIVVGAGPAGARFARQAARAGHSVVVLEQGRVGRPLACSGHVSHDVWRYTGPIREQLVQNEISEARFHVDGPAEDPTPYRYYREDTISTAIDRVGLDRHLAERARSAGATVREHNSVFGVTEHEDHVAVDVRTPSGTTTVRGRILAGCDGATSRVRDELGVAEPTELLHGVFGHDPTPDHDSGVDVHLNVPDLFGWRIPRGEAGVEYGIASGPETAPDQFDRLITGYNASLKWRKSGAIPIGPPPSVTTKRAFLLGDAAGQTKPFTGGGIVYALTAADIAARAITPWDPSSLSRYETAWRDELSTEIRIGAALRRAYKLPRPIQRLGLAATAGKIDVHMDRPTSLLDGLRP